MSNDTLPTADNLGILSGNRAISDFVGTTDPIDIFRFRLAENANVGFTLRGLSETIEVALVADRNSNGVIDNGEQLDRETAGSNGDSFSEALPVGNYFVVINTLFNNRSTQYELNLNAVSRPGNVNPDPGNILRNALNLGAIPTSGTRTLRDYVGVLDSSDIYRFTLTEDSDVGFTLRGLSETISVSLVADQNNNGVIDRGETLESETAGASGDSFSEALSAGTYFVVVDTFFNNRSTQYELALSSTPNLDGDNVLRGTPGRDIIRGLGGNDVLFGLGGNDRLFGGDGNDRLVGGGGNDRLVGGTGFDTLLGGSGNDVMIGGNDNDRLLGAGGRDVLRGNQGNDILNAGGDNDRVFGGDGNDRLNGQAGNDNLRGGAGRDVLTGGPGNDTLNGGLGNDVIVAGPGRDRIITILESRSFDRVRDFTPGQDQIVLGGGLSVNQIRLQQQGRNTRVLFGGETFLLLQGVNPGQLSASDFI